MYDTILVPTDGSDHSVRAAEHAAYLARTFDATVHLLTAVDVQSAGGLFDAGGVDEAFVERLEAQGEAAISAVEGAVQGSGEVRTALVRGDPRESILEFAEENEVDVIAMGTHGRTGVRRFVTGSVTEHVVRLADVPVLTVRETDASRIDGEYEEVLIPTDGSDPAMAAVDHGLAIAGAIDARVHSVYVSDVDGIGGDEFTPSSELRRSLQEAGQRATQAIADRAAEVDVDCVTEVRTGSPAETLLAYADERDVDLIAMGTHGRTGVQRYLLGSTTERVIRRAEVPVLAVTPEDRE